MVELAVVDVRTVQGGEYPLVLLRATDAEGDFDGRVLPIAVGPAEAQAIALALRRRPTPRPMTHDLFVQVLGELSARVVQVVITEMRDRVFYGELHIESGGVARVVSCRPSDGIAVALRCEARILVADEVMAEHSVEDPDADPAGEEAEQVIEEFRSFIEDISPDDFK
jgi:hypothetical protein